MHKQIITGKSSPGNAEATIRRWEKSGLSQAEFCRRERMPQWKLSEWKRRVNEKSVQSMRAAPAIKFAPVTVVTGANNEQISTTTHSAPAERLPALDIVVIRLPEGSNLVALQQIVQAATSRC